MKLTVVGCAGSFPSAESSASCYLIEAPYDGGTYRLVVDLGSGALGDLQRYVDLRDVDAIALSHLHADHCFDLSGLYVFSKYHPDGALPRIPVLAPHGAADRLAEAYGIDEPVGMTEQFEFLDHVDGETVQSRPVRDHLAPRRPPGDGVRAAHRHRHPRRSSTPATPARPRRSSTSPPAPTSSCARRRSSSRATTRPTCTSPAPRRRSVATRAGVGRLLITHIPAWTDRAEVESDTKSTWDGPCELVTPGSVYELGR